MLESRPAKTRYFYHFFFSSFSFNKEDQYSKDAELCALMRYLIRRVKKIERA